jgi:two-component system response regulator HupR/HoxA
MLHLRLGNLDDAETAYVTALRIAREVQDPRGTALAMLGLGQVHLSRGQLDEARSQFSNALEIALLRHHLYAVSVAYCRLARVALLDDRVAEAREACDKARDVAGRGAAGREEALETALVHAEVLVAEGKAGDALAVATDTAEAARTAGERAVEVGAVITLAQAQAAVGRADEASKTYVRAERQLSRDGDRGRLAQVHWLFGRHLLAQNHDRTRLEGLHHLLDAREAYHRLGVWDSEAHILLDLAEEELRQKAVDRAADRMDRARSLVREHGPRPRVESRLAELADRLELALAENAMSTRDSYDVHRRMERILRSDRSFSDKLVAFMKALDGTVPFDGAMLLSRDGQGLTVVGSVGHARGAGSRIALPVALASAEWVAEGRPLVFLGLGNPDKRRRLEPLSAGRDLDTALAVPLEHGAHGAVLYLDRLAPTGRRAFNQTEVSSCMALTQQLSGFLEEAVLRNQRGLRDLESTRNNLALADIVTENREMLAILGQVSRVADSDLTLLLQGETGTGKKLLAHALHRCSPRASKPFVTVDCAALPESVLESELFGHMKGAFTGATADRAGLLAEADGGTIFLDEIDKTDIAVQRRFLHLLDSGEVRPVGGRSYRRLDIRVVCATSAADLRQEVEEGRFIKDLYFRLNDVSVMVPPLRRRKEDIRLLCDYFTDLYSQEIGKDVPGVSQLAMKRLLAYDWPGNVREFEKVMRRAITLADDGETIGIDLLPPRLLEEEPQESTAPVSAGPAGGSLRDQVERLERQLVLDTLEETGWNKSRTAQILGLTRKGLKNKIARYGVDRRAGFADDD